MCDAIALPWRGRVGRVRRCFASSGVGWGDGLSPAVVFQRIDFGPAAARRFNVEVICTSLADGSPPARYASDPLPPGEERACTATPVQRRANCARLLLIPLSRL